VAGPDVADVDGNTYQSITVCGQTWIKKNLSVSKYTDGTPIPQITDISQWGSLTTGAWCYCISFTGNTIADYGAIYGKFIIGMQLRGFMMQLQLQIQHLERN